MDFEGDPMNEERTAKSDTRECGWLGCGDARCEPVCAGVPAVEKDAAPLCDACLCGQHGDCPDVDCECAQEYCNGWGLTRVIPPVLGETP